MLSKPTILVCTDFRPASDLALISAESIRKKVGGKIHVVHISDFPVQWDWIAQESSVMYQYERLNFDLLKSLNQILATQLARCEVDCTPHVSLGPIYEGIIESMAEIKPDIVIMGHKGLPHGLFNLGSVVMKVVASSKIPVLVIKKKLAVPLGKIAGLVDTNSVMRSIITATEELSFLLSAEPEIISLWKNTSSQYHNEAPIEKVHQLYKLDKEHEEVILIKMKHEIARNLDEHSKCKIRVEISNERKVAYHLAKILEEEHVDLAIMKRHQRNILEKMFIGSETRRMLELFKGNILVLPP